MHFTNSQVCDFCIISTGAKLKNVVLVGGNYIAPKVCLEGEVLDKDVHVYLQDGNFYFFLGWFSFAHSLWQGKSEKKWFLIL